MVNFRNLAAATILLALGGLAVAQPTQPEKKKDIDKKKPTGVLWRTDYNAARMEAVDKQRPIVIVVYRDYPTSTRLFIDISEHAELTSFLNSRTIPLKIDGKEGYVARTLEIDRYPTLILAHSDGKIRHTLVGYQDPDELLAILRRAFPEPMR